MSITICFGCFYEIKTKTHMGVIIPKKLCMKSGAFPCVEVLKTQQLYLEKHFFNLNPTIPIPFIFLDPLTHRTCFSIFSRIFLHHFPFLFSIFLYIIFSWTLSFYIYNLQKYITITSSLRTSMTPYISLYCLPTTYICLFVTPKTTPNHIFLITTHNQSTNLLFSYLFFFFTIFLYNYVQSFDALLAEYTSTNSY